MKTSSSPNQALRYNGHQTPSLPISAKQALISQPAINNGTSNGFSESSGRPIYSLNPLQKDNGSPHAGGRVKRALIEPQQGINESFQDFQKRHFQWRHGTGPIPANEGKEAPKPWYQTALDVFLGVLTGPGIEPMGGLVPEAPKVDIEIPSTSGDSSLAVTAPTPSSSSGTSEAAKIDWSNYMREDTALLEKNSDEAVNRQEKLYDEAQIHHPNTLDSDSSSVNSDSSQGPDYDLVSQYTHESNEFFNNRFRYDGDAGRISHPEQIGELADIVDGLPTTQGVTLYRGGSGGRGTSGEHFRTGKINVGDQLVNTDFTSFTENPFLVKDFAGDNTGRTQGGYKYDDTSVVFVLEHPQDAHAIAPLSATPSEAESLYTPGHHFMVTDIQTLTVDGHPLVQVRIAETGNGPSSGKTFDFRTGEPFDRQTMEKRIGKEYTDRFFKI